MKTNCKKFSDSISPLTIPKSNKEIRELLHCLKIDVEAYISSLEVGTDEYVNHFKESILPILKKKKLLKSFESQLIKYKRVLEAKTVSVSHDFRGLINKLWDDIKQINLLRKYKNMNDRKQSEYLTESLKIAYVDFSNLLIIASQLFFALEFYCKILCALGCVKFALKVARSEVIHHNQCWKQLKRFSNKNCRYCEICIVSDTCISKIDFQALSRIYSYSMKIRQLADYTSKFVSFDIFKSGLIEPPFIYFTSLLSLLRNDSIIYECMADVTPDIFYERKMIVEELVSPFLWGDEKRLKEILDKDKDDDFYNYLLGRFYYQYNRFDEAIKYLEKAKKLNPNNADVWKLLGTIYDDKAKTKMDLEKAIQHYRKAKDLEPTNHNILFELGILELAFGDYSSSLENLIKASEFASTDFDRIKIFAVLSEVYRMRGMIEKSEHYLKQYQAVADFKFFKSELYLNDVIKWLQRFIEERRKLQ